MVRCLVTGAAGFIGSNLVDALLLEGHDVVGLDNLRVGRLSNLEQASAKPNFRSVEADVCDRAVVSQAAEGCEWIFHLAALADIVPSIQSPEPYFRANVDGTLSVLEAARAKGCQRFIYSASSSCYGIPDLYPTPETAELRPMYPYALTKLLGEQLVMHWLQTYRLSGLSLRFFNVFGPRARTSGTYGAVFGVFLAQKLAGKPFTIVGDGTQTRDFTYVSDIVMALQAAAKSDVTGEIMNVGSGGTYSVNRLVELLGGERTYIPKRPGEPDCTYADIGKICRLLSWQPKTSFEDGVGRLLSQIEMFRDAPLWNPQSIADATKDWFRYLGNKQ